MPSAAPIKPSQIQNYFETASLDAAELLLDIVTAKVKSRKQKSTDAKAAQKKAAKTSKTAAPAAAPSPVAEASEPGAGEVE